MNPVYILCFMVILTSGWTYLSLPPPQTTKVLPPYLPRHLRNCFWFDVICFSLRNFDFRVFISYYNMWSPACVVQPDYPVTIGAWLAHDCQEMPWWFKRMINRRKCSRRFEEIWTPSDKLMASIPTVHNHVVEVAFLLLSHS